MRVVDPSPYVRFMGEPKLASLGMKPGLAWLPVGNLRIDPAYQRHILRQGARNIAKIAEHFDWALFGIVVVANIGDNLFAIVDGQHRTTAAALRGIDEVPCIIIEANPSKQASAFAAINGAVTAISPLAIFAAEVAAGKPEAVALSQACAQAGVRICRYPVPSDKMKPGDTLAVKVLQNCFKVYGEQILVVSLRCIMKSARGQAGFVQAAAIKAVCHVLEAERSWYKHEPQLLAAMAKFNLADEIGKAQIAAKSQKRQVNTVLALRLFDYLDEEIG